MEASLIFPVLVLLLMFFLHTTVILGFMQVEKQAEQIHATAGIGYDGGILEKHTSE
ncbi:MAG: hypothetical protein ACLUD0_07245 [Eubacterium ramulus]